MRIISGKFKGRRFYPPAKNWPTRPTTDFAKEALFNILQNRFSFEDIAFLDLFGGTGSHSFECISRGCSAVTYVDKFPGCIQFVKSLSKALGVEDAITINRKDVFKFLRTCTEKYDYIFAGPPYALQELTSLPDVIFEGGYLKEEGLFVLEHHQNHQFTDHSRYEETRKYGQCHFSFFPNTAD